MSSTNIPIGKLKISDFNVRKHVGDVSELAQSIAERGILQPLLVRPENGKYGIVIGSRRFKAAKEANLSDVPVTIQDLNESDALLVSLIENLQRNDLSPKDTVDTLAELLKGYSTRNLAKRIGKSDSYVQGMAQTAHLMGTLEKHRIKVDYYPNEEERNAGRAIPIQHIVYLAEAINHIGDVAEPKQIDLAKAVAPKTQEETRKVAQYFKRHPNESVETILENALGITSSGGFGGGGGTGTAEEKLSDQIHNKLMWNLKRNTHRPIYTIGYSHTSLAQFIEKLKTVKIEILVDVRRNPKSQYRPEFNKEDLERSLKNAKIGYWHVPELGVQSELRDDLATEDDYRTLWRWYDKNVVHGEIKDVPKGTPPISILESIWEQIEKSSEGAIAFMCMEADPTKCHRHRIALALESLGEICEPLEERGIVDL